MKLTKLTLSNIRSYRHEEIELPTGTVLLAGDVGSGKTTILLAIEYALFGLQPGQRGSALLATSETEGRVILEGEIAGKTVIIERTLKRNAKGVNQEECSLTVEGVRESLSVTELKSKILNLLRYPEEFVKKTNLLYRYTVYAPQEEMKKIILEDPESRLDIIRHIFGIDKYRRVKENAALVATKLREKVRLAAHEARDIEKNKGLILAGESTAELLDKRIAELDVKIVTRKNIRKNVEVEKLALESKKKEANQLEKEIEKATLQLKNKELLGLDIVREEKKLAQEIGDQKLEFDENRYKEILAALGTERANIDAETKKIIEAKSKISSLERQTSEDVEKRTRIFNIQMCPTCLQDVSDNHKHNILNETESQITRRQHEIKEFAQTQEETEKNVARMQHRIKELETAKSTLEAQRVRLEGLTRVKMRLDEIQKTKQSTQKDVSALIDHLGSLKSAILQYSSLESLVKSKDAELRGAFNEEKKAEIEYAEAKKEREFIARERHRLTVELAAQEKMRQESLKLAQFESWLSGSFLELIAAIERRILLKVRDEFSRLFNKWFSLLTTDAFQVRLDENFSPIILQKGYELDYDFLSGGERTGIALAYRLALNQILSTLHSNLMTRGLIILDEPTDGFSDQQLDKVRDILREINMHQLIIVSHEQKIESFVDTIIRVKKEQGYSTVG